MTKRFDCDGERRFVGGLKSGGLEVERAVCKLDDSLVPSYGGGAPATSAGLRNPALAPRTQQNAGWLHLCRGTGLRDLEFTEPGNSTRNHPVVIPESRSSEACWEGQCQEGNIGGEQGSTGERAREIVDEQGRAEINEQGIEEQRRDGEIREVESNRTG